MKTQPRFTQFLAIALGWFALHQPACASATGKAPKAPEWKVDSPPGASRFVSLNVSRGTWMSVDVSPNGRHIVFDLLGDLYVVPIDGGEGRALTDGMAWDMQPRFSPDGRWIAFTSDRGGGDNLWVMPASGGQPKQLTKEAFRLFSSPNWSPDSQYVVGRKHFTASRSLGAGEMWIVHIDGGEGVALTRKTSDEKDTGEPALSPDGRWLYYSQDVSPGKSFEYNKDPHAGIYAIFRVDRHTGAIEKILGGTGGAARPTPSPDGRWLAFVRRVGEKTALYALDLKSGAQWLLDDGLDRDMQETWAIHGVYPHMSFTPDSREVVYWARGGIWRTAIGDSDEGRVQIGEPKEISFRAQGQREVRDAVRLGLQVAPEQFPVRLVRSAELGPDGQTAVFEALGTIWVKAGQQAQRRLLPVSAPQAFAPSFSRDGRLVVYATWDSAELGGIWVMSLDGSSPPRRLTPEPGLYVEPSFSPDGALVAYRKVQGGWLTSPLWSDAPGLYVVGLDGANASPQKVLAEGVEPHFGASADRLFFSTSSPDGIRVLESCGLLGEERREHLKVKHGQFMRVSPDEQMLAWSETYETAVAPFPRIGGALELSKKSKALPVKKAAGETGFDLRFSADGKSLTWLLGPSLKVRRLADLFADVFANSVPAPASVELGWQEPTFRPEGWLALVGARVITLRGDEVIEDGAVLVRRDRIAAIGPRAQVQIPEGAEIIDVTGHTIFPGLVDVHAHGAQGHQGLVPRHNWSNVASLAFGVTTLHDPSNSTLDVFRAAELQRAGNAFAPRIFSTGTILYGADLSIKAEVDSLDDAKLHLRRMKAVGAISVKSYNQPRRDQRQQILEAARAIGLMVVPEGGSTLMHNLTMIVDGHTGLEHALPVAQFYDDVVQLWSGTRVGYTPTLGVAYGGLFGENYWYQESEVWRHPLLTALVPRFALDGRARRPMTAPDAEWNHIKVARGCKTLWDKGVSVQLGAHGQLFGLAAHWELWSLVQGGFSPMEALRAASLQGARYLGLDKDLGSLEPGKLADLVVVEGNPLANIRESDQVRYVVQGGSVFAPAPFARIYPQPTPPVQNYWEQPGVAPSQGGRSAHTHSGCAGCNAD